LVVPLAMGLLDGNGQEIATRVLLADAADNEFIFEDIGSPPIPSLLRGFSAPVKLSGVSPDRLRFLAAHDTDPFVRWESGQQYATSVLLDMIPRWRRGETLTVEPALIEAMAANLANSEADPAFKAETLSLPGEAFLADQMPIADIDAIHAVRDTVRTAIGSALAVSFRSTYDHLADTGAYGIDGEAIGRRALRNTCLAYLVAGGDPDGVRLAKAQFDAAQNMTDVLAALGVLSMVDCAERGAALAAFHTAWRDDPLVLDKWFAIQAMSPLPNALDAVRALASHPDFDLRNPNRIRSLVGTFASANQVRFHDVSGGGYRFLADTIIRLDPTNGQVAARMVSPLGQWRRVDPERKALMQAELRRILALPNLTTNTFEMASKSLA
jgi:aminopeptidase N